MTRETKIGLLVGLAFIIVIGILLSDHINTAGDTLQATKTQIYSTVEAGINTPHSQPQGETVMIAPQAVVPQNRVKTEPENEPRPNTGSSMIVVGPGKDPSQVQVPQHQQQVVQGPVQTQDGSDQTNAQGPVVLSQGNGQVAGNDRPANPEVATGNSGINQLANEAGKHNEEIVSASNGKPVGISVPKPGVDLVARPDARQVVAEENDTVSKFASKYMGANTKANREAIIRANPSVGADGSKVFAGKTYVIPAPAAGPQTTAGGNQGVAQAQPQQQPVHLSPQATNPTPTPTPNTAMYTVKENDTLWKIASEQLGSGARYTEIVELNKDVLKGGAQVRPNMRLKLPAKAVATNN
jgi:nucleoid-associated protein YgaU